MRRKPTLAFSLPDGLIVIRRSILRNRYIGLFKGTRDLMVVLRVNMDGSLMLNFMQADPKTMNKHRIGVLRHGK